MSEENADSAVQFEMTTGALDKFAAKVRDAERERCSDIVKRLAEEEPIAGDRLGGFQVSYRNGWKAAATAALAKIEGWE